MTLDRQLPDRARMVRAQLESRGIRDRRVLEAMGRVPREAFVRGVDTDRAYDDGALPIGHEQTISQPYMVAYTLERARIGRGSRVLDVGTGSGYAAAVASLVAGEVFSIERVPELAEAARERLDRLGYEVTVVCGDGSLGLPEHAPFDAIVSAAAAPLPPQPWKDQLVPGGRIVTPVGGVTGQKLIRLTQTPDGFERESLLSVRYVRLIGKSGYRR